jgi:phosphomannomutase
VTEARAPIRFGTDGWRAVIAHEFTFSNVERVAQAYSDYLRQQPVSSRATPPLVIVGYDQRFLSEHFARRAAEILAGNGLPIALFSEAAPTPLISWAVRRLGAIGGVVITASHNPPDFNGFKIKAPWGGSATLETTSEVEKLVDASTPKRSEIIKDWHELLEPAIKAYCEQVSSYVDLNRLRRSPGPLVIDPMHGSAKRWVESFLSGGTLKVDTIRSDRDPLFGGVNPEPIDRNLSLLKERVAETKALVGLATDGDADRVGAVNELAETMTMHDVVPLILLHLVRNRQMTGGVVVTFSQSVLTKRIATAHHLPLHETPIGFKYIADLMLKEDILLGAEESGGIGVKGHIPERDGILNSLLFLEAIVAAGKPPSEMLREMHHEFGEFHFGRRDLHMEVQQGKDLVTKLATNPPARFAGYEVNDVQSLDGTKLVFADESWVLFRQSGTEPVLRVYAEATSMAKLEELLDEGERASLAM